MSRYTQMCSTSNKLVDGYGPVSSTTSGPDPNQIAWKSVHQDGTEHILAGDGVHTYQANTTKEYILENPNKVLIDEGQSGTKGRFKCNTVKINATANTTTSGTISWPVPISATLVSFMTDVTHAGDFVSMSVAKDSVTGTITANTANATAWTSQNYTVGTRVTYTSGGISDKLYTCILNTVSSEVPTNTTYWKRGFEIAVSSTVIQHADVGHNIKLYDGTNTNDMGITVSVDVSNNKIYVEKNSSNSFASATPTYIKQSVYNIKDYEINVGGTHTIGLSKIGGSLIPADTVVTIDYQNTNIAVAKTFIGKVEYMM